MQFPTYWVRNDARPDVVHPNGWFRLATTLLGMCVLDPAVSPWLRAWSGLCWHSQIQWYFMQCLTRWYVLLSQVTADSSAEGWSIGSAHHRKCLTCDGPHTEWKRCGMSLCAKSCAAFDGRMILCRSYHNTNIGNELKCCSARRQETATANIQVNKQACTFTSCWLVISQIIKKVKRLSYLHRIFSSTLHAISFINIWSNKIVKYCISTSFSW